MKLLNRHRDGFEQVMTVRQFQWAVEGRTTVQLDAGTVVYTNMGPLLYVRQEGLMLGVKPQPLDLEGDIRPPRGDFWGEASHPRKGDILVFLDHNYIELWKEGKRGLIPLGYFEA